jgi:acyl carrier protein phosphodiesterase
VCSLKAFLVEPEMLKAFKKRANFDSKSEIESLKKHIKQLRNNKLRLVSEKERISNDLLNNSNHNLRRHWQEKLAKMLDKISEIERIISEKEIKSLENSTQLKDDQYIQILEEFNSIFSDRDSEEQKDLVKTLIRNVESTVTKNSDNTDSGEIKIDYVCDHYLISEWEDIKEGLKKKCELR